MSSRELGFSSAELFQPSLQPTRHSLSPKQCKRLDIYCFRPEEHKILHPNNSDNVGDESKKNQVYPYWTKRHRSLTGRIVELTKRRQVDVALKILADEMQKNYRPNRRVMNSAMAACVHCGDLPRAHALFDSMLEPGSCGVDGVTYAILIKGLGQSRMLDEAYELVEALENGTAPGGPALTEVHLRTLLNGFADAGEMMRARGVLLRYRPLFNKTGPSIFTYNILIKGYARSTNPLEALKLREDINRLGLQPQKITFNSLILACIRGGDLKEALQVLREMKEAARQVDCSDLRPDIVTYTTLIQGFGQQGLFDGVASLVKELRSSEDCPLDRVAYGVVIDAFLLVESCSGLMEGLSLLKEMLDLSKENKKLRPKPHVFLSLMRAFAAKGDLETVKRLHSEMIPLAAGPVTPRHRAEADELLIEAAVNDGQLGVARQLLKDMKALKMGIPLSSRAYLAVIRLDFFSNFSDDIFHPYKLQDGMSMDDPVEKWMCPVEEVKPEPPNVRLSQVVMRFFRDAVVPVMDESGVCVGVVHREDCFELNASLGSLMRSPPPSVRANTSVGRALTVLLESEVKMVAVLEIKKDYVLAKDANDKLVGLLTLDRVLSLKVDYPNLLMGRMQQFLTESSKNDGVA
eukprot:c20872_g1_i1 orf=71-1969(+)